MSATRGFTMVEMMLVLLLLGTLIGMALPALRPWAQATRGDALMRQLASLLALARTEAAARGRVVTLCPTRDGQSCGSDWAEGMMLFADRNGDRTLNQDDVVVRVLLEASPTGTLAWRAFGNRRYLQIDAMGFLRYQSGHFLYCPTSRDPRLARQLVVSATGRARLTRDTDGDGIREDSAGQALVCR